MLVIGTFQLVIFLSDNFSQIIYMFLIWTCSQYPLLLRLSVPLISPQESSGLPFRRAMYQTFNESTRLEHVKLFKTYSIYCCYLRLLVVKFKTSLNIISAYMQLEVNFYMSFQQWTELHIENIHLYCELTVCFNCEYE